MSFISPHRLYSYFSDTFTTKKSSQSWYAFKCPFCNEIDNRKKMAVHFRYGMVKCWICGYKENAVQFAMDYEGMDYHDAKAYLKNYRESNVNLDIEDNSTIEYSEIGLPHGYKSILEGNSIMAKRARDYMTGRGFDLIELDKAGIGYVDVDEQSLPDDENYFGYIIIPFKKRGKLVYYIGRDFIGQFLRYKNPSKDTFGIGKADLIFNEDAFHIYDTVFMFEGALDAMTVGREATSTQGWSLSPTQFGIIVRSQAHHVVMAPDVGVDNMGVSFYDKAVKLGLELMKHKAVTIIKMDDYLDEGKDVNDMGRQKFMSIYKQSSPLTMGDAYKLLMKR